VRRFTLLNPLFDDADLVEGVGAFPPEQMSMPGAMKRRTQSEVVGISVRSITIDRSRCWSRGYCSSASRVRSAAFRVFREDARWGSSSSFLLAAFAFAESRSRLKLRQSQLGSDTRHSGTGPGTDRQVRDLRETEPSEAQCRLQAWKKNRMSPSPGDDVWRGLHLPG